MKPLSEREYRAVNSLMRGNSQIGALKFAGFKREGSNNSDVFKRPHVKREIEKRRKLMADRANVDAKWIVDRLKAIADLDVGKLLDDEGKPFPITNLSTSLRKALSVTIVNGRVKISQDDRLKALKQLAEVLGLTDDKIQVDVNLTEALLEGRARAAARNTDDN